MSDREPRQAHRQMFFRREAERIFHDFLYPETGAPLGPPPSQLRLAANVFEDEQRIVVEVELPGVTKDEVALYVLRDRLIIEGVKPEQRRGIVSAGAGGERPSFLCAERHFGAFERSVSLDAPVDTSRIEARLRDGLLVVTLPKIADRRGKKKRVAID